MSDNWSPPEGDFANWAPPESDFSPAQKANPTYDPTEGMSTSDKFLAGVGKSFVDTGRGIYQLGASLGHAMGMVSDDKMSQIQADADESKKYDAPLMDTGAGMAGNIAGATAQIAALPELLPAKAAAVPLLADTASAAAYSGAQPIATGESRGINAALGAAGGAAGSVAGKALGFVAQPIRNALDTAGNSAVSILKGAGIPLDLAQQTGSRVARTLKNIIADNPLIGPSAFPEEQGHAFNRAVLRTMGITDPSVTAADDATMEGGRAAIKSVMDDIAARNGVGYDKELESRLTEIGRDAPGALSPDALSSIQHNINTITDAAANNNEVIPGAVYQKLRSNLAGWSKDPQTAPVAGDIQEALDDAFQRSVSPEDQSALALARQRYRAMKQIEGAIDPATGNISPGTLLSKINTKTNRNQALYGQGDQTLVDLAKAGKNVLAPRNPDSGTARRLAGMAAMGALAGGGDELLHGNPNEAIKVGIAGAALPWLGRQAVENPAIVKGITGWNDSPLLKGATDTLRRGAAAATPPVLLEQNHQPDNVPRASGGRVDIDSLVDRLMTRWKAAKRDTDKSTKSLLQVPDEAIVNALKVAQRQI